MPIKLNRIASAAAAILALVGQALAGGPTPSSMPTFYGLRIWDANAAASYSLMQDGHADWARFQSGINYNPQELEVYGSQAQGTASVTAGSATIKRVSGSPFDPSWVGKAYFYFNSIKYTVQTVTDTNTLTVNYTFGTAVTGAVFHYVATTGVGTCSSSGTTVTLTSGQPFIPFIDSFVLAGTSYTVSSVTDTSHLVLSSSPGTKTNVACSYGANINDEITAIRLQKFIGSTEENLTITARAVGSYWIASQIAGAGNYYPVFISSGARSGIPYGQIAAQPNGDVTIGGTYGYDSLRLLAPGAATVNRWQIQAPTSSGGQPVMQTVGSDTNIAGAFDSQGAGGFYFTTHGFANYEFKILANNGVSYLSVGSDATSPAITANSNSASVADVKLVPKGSTGRVLMTGVAVVPGYTVSGLPSCSSTLKGGLAYVTDATSPAYNASLTGGGSTVVPVFCNGSSWTSH